MRGARIDCAGKAERRREPGLPSTPRNQGPAVAIDTQLLAYWFRFRLQLGEQFFKIGAFP
jgi:hypothetical protein